MRNNLSGKIKQIEPGTRFGKWTVTAFSHTANNKAKSAYWHVECDCGTLSTVSGTSLRIGQSAQCKSCSGRVNGKKGHRARKHLYVVSCGPYIKIGSTDDIDIRMTSLKSYNPYPITLIYYGEYEGDDEQMYHKIFEHRHLHGEWFVSGVCEV